MTHADAGRERAFRSTSEGGLDRDAFPSRLWEEAKHVDAFRRFFEEVEASMSPG